MSLATAAPGILRAMGANLYTVERRTAGTYVSGRATPGSTSTFQVLALVISTQGGIELERLPEGTQTSDVKEIYTTSELYAGTEAHAPDVFYYKGETYEVGSVIPWDVAGIWQVMASRRERQQ